MTMKQVETTVCIETEEENISPPAKDPDQEIQDSSSGKIFIFWRRKE